MWGPLGCYKLLLRAELHICRAFFLPNSSVYYSASHSVAGTFSHSEIWKSLIRHQMESLNDVEEQARKINVKEQAQITKIHALEQDISSAKSSNQDIKDEADQMLKRTVDLDKQKLISSKNSNRASIVETLNLMQQERISVSAKLLQKRLYNSKLREEMDSKLQQNQMMNATDARTRKPHGKSALSAIRAASPSSIKFTIPRLKPDELGGFIMGSDRQTHEESMEKKLFGTHRSNLNLVNNIRIGMPIFLYNFDEEKLYGGFISISTGIHNLDGFAFKKHSAVTKFPSQVRVESNHIYPALDKEEFIGMVHTYKGKDQRFSFELDVDQTESLIELFVEKEMMLV